jgi:hypothetical protein
MARYMRRVDCCFFFRWAVVLASVVGGLLATPAARAQSFGEKLLFMTLEAATSALLDTVIPEPVHHPSVKTPEARAELSDWVDPSTGSTAHVGRACEQRYVAYLTGTRYSNYLEVKLFNDSDDDVAIVARSPVFEEANGPAPDSREKFRGKPYRAGRHSGTYLSYMLEKARFYELRHFAVVFELSFANGRTCQTKIDFSRVLPAALSSFKIYSNKDAALTYGVHGATGSLLDSVGPVGTTTSISFGWFPAMQHGLRFEASFDNFDSDRFAFGVLLLPSYEYRIFFGPRVSYSFGIGAGAYLFTVHADVPVSYSHWALMVRERMQLKFELPEFNVLHFALGPVVTFGVLPGGPFGPRELSGALYTGSLELSITM